MKMQKKMPYFIKKGLKINMLNIKSIVKLEIWFFTIDQTMIIIL